MISSITLCKRSFFLLKSSISLGQHLILCLTTEWISTGFARASLKNCEITDPTHTSITLCSDHKLHFNPYGKISKCYLRGGRTWQSYLLLLLLQLPFLLTEGTQIPIL